MFIACGLVMSGALVAYMSRLKCINECNKGRKWLLMVAIVLLYGLSWFLVEQKFGSGLMSVAYYQLTVLLVAFAVIDALSMEVPIDLLVMTGLLGIMATFLNPNLIWYQNIVVMLISGCVLCGMVKLSRGAIGGGDAWLMAMVVLYMGWEHGLLVFLIGLVLSGALGIILLLSGMANRKTVMPFVPFMALVQIGLLLV